MLTGEMPRRLVRALTSSRLFQLYRNAHGDWRYLFLPIAWRLAAILVPRRRIRLGPVSFTLQCDNEITHFRWFLFGRKEPEISRFLDTYVHGDGIFLDVGANIGVFTLYATKRHPDLRVVSLEPEYSNLHYLKENLLRNDVEDRVQVFSVAASDCDALSTLHIQDMTPGAAVHTESADPISVTAEGYQVKWGEGIATATIDSLFTHLDSCPVAMKIDTDGNEAKVLTGARQTLANATLRAIAVEMPASATDAETCHTLLVGAGFGLAWSSAETRNEIWTRGDAGAPNGIINESDTGGRNDQK